MDSQNLSDTPTRTEDTKTTMPRPALSIDDIRVEGPVITTKPAEAITAASPETQVPAKSEARLPFSAIIPAVFVGVALIVITVFAFKTDANLDTQNDKTVVTSASQQEAAASNITPKDTSAEVNTVSQDIDDSLSSIDSQKDFSEDELSDITLEL